MYLLVKVYININIDTNYTYETFQAVYWTGHVNMDIIPLTLYCLKCSLATLHFKYIQSEVLNWIWNWTYLISYKCGFLKTIFQMNNSLRKHNWVPYKEELVHTKTTSNYFYLNNFIKKLEGKSKESRLALQNQRLFFSH